MRKFFYAVGLLVLLLGLSSVVASAVDLPREHFGAGSLLLIGVITASAGGVISWLARSRVCRNCLQRINTKALLCPHCGGVVV